MMTMSRLFPFRLFSRRVPRTLLAVMLPALILPAALLLALAAAGCQPRERVPASVDLLLSPEALAVQYRRLVLPNDLKVMLISDPRADRSAASLSVGAGSLEDPPDHPGLAHFLEHMLFLGTQKYPDPGAFQQFMAKHAGFTNAYTADDNTTFFFEVTDGAFPEALDRFAQFFIAPTFAEAYAQREMNAVDSEHAKNIENDFWRVRQIEHDLMQPDHPISHFATGTKKTLAGVGRDQLLAFYRREYSANRMTLAVVGKAGLDQQEAWVRQRFEAIADQRLPRVRYSPTILEKRAALRLVTVDPVADVRSLHVEFALPPTEQLYRSKPLALIGGVLGNEGEGSLLSLLKAENLATSLSAGESEGTADYSTFQVVVGLTPQGAQRYPEILRQLLGTIRKLEQVGITRYQFDEGRVMAKLAFQYRERQDASQLASQTSAMMQIYPLQELPEAPFKFEEYAPGLYRSLLARLTPDNMLVTVMARGQPSDRTEPYYQARYGYRELTGEPYEKLAQAQADPRWSRPAPNPFIPDQVALTTPRGPLRITDVTLHLLNASGMSSAMLDKLLPWMDVPFTGGEALVQRMRTVLDTEEQRRYLPLLLRFALAQPTKLVESDLARVWYLPDWRFRQPKAEMVFKIFIKDAYASPRQAALASLYVNGLEESLNEFGYPVREAGLDYSLDAVKSGLTLSLSGYSPRMLTLLQRLSERLTGVNLSPERFASVKDRLRRSIQNRRVAQPYEQGRHYQEQLMEQPSVGDDALLHALDQVTLAQVQDFARTAFQHVYLQGVVVGNLPREAALRGIGDMLAQLRAQPLPPAERVTERVRTLAPGADLIFTERLQVNNSLGAEYFQAGPSQPRLRGALQIIARPLGESFFFIARTQQQLGYLVYANLGQMQKMLGLFMVVQSGAYPADLLLDRTEAFIPKFIEDFKRLPPEVFEKYRQAVIQDKLERDKTLADVARRLFWVAFRHDEDWDYLSGEIRAAESLSHDQVTGVLTQVLGSPARRRLVMRLVGKDHAVKARRGQPVTLPAQGVAKTG